MFNSDYPLDWYIIVIALLGLFLLVSLLFSGLLLIGRKKKGIVLFYFQFPLKMLAAAGLTFGFIFEFTDFKANDTNASRIVILTVLMLEVLRLILFIRIQRKYFRQTRQAENTEEIRN